MVKNKVFGYVRNNNAIPLNGHGLKRQERVIKRYASINNLELVKIFREKGCSGSREERPALAKMMLSLGRNEQGIKTVIIETIDHLAKPLMVQEAIIRDFHLKGFEIVSVREGINLCGDEPTRKFIRQMMGAVAEYDKKMLTSKLYAARKRKKRKYGGKCEGRKGYRDTEKGRAIIKKIIALRRKPGSGKRKTWQQVADCLNNAGVRTLNGNQWTLYRVQQIIKPAK